MYRIGTMVTYGVGNDNYYITGVNRTSQHESGGEYRYDIEVVGDPTYLTGWIGHNQIILVNSLDLDWRIPCTES